MREIAWVRAALRNFEKFPAGAQECMKDALAIAALGQKADIAKPMKGIGPGVMEIALPYQTNAYRVVYAVRIGRAIWVLHAFQKKSTKGIKTSKKDIDLIKSRLKQVKEMER